MQVMPMLCFTVVIVTVDHGSCFERVSAYRRLGVGSVSATMLPAHLACHAP